MTGRKVKYTGENEMGKQVLRIYNGVNTEQKTVTARTKKQ